MIYWISLLPTFLQTVRNGLVTYYKMMEKKFIQIIKNVKSHLLTFLKMIAFVLILIFFVTMFFLIMVSILLMDSIQDFYDCFFKKKYPIKRQLYLSTSCRMCKIIIKKLKKGLYGLKSHLRLPK